MDSAIPDKKDYVGVAVMYAYEAIADKKRKKFGKWIRLAAKRFLADLKHSTTKNARFHFDEWHANDACDFIEKLPHVEGEWDTPTITMHPSHIFFVVQLFGFRNLQGGRRFSSALFAVARKNAKSLLCSAILLYCLCCEEHNGPQVISAATTGSQARIVFNAAKRMVDLTEDLREQFDLGPWANAISRVEVGGTFKPINAKASTQDGLNPSHVGIDEIHAHKNHDLLNVLKSAAGARKAPLFLYTTTEGYESPGPWAEIRHFSKQLLQNIFVADHHLALYYALDDDDDDFDESKWVKANPLSEVNPIIFQEMRKLAIDAKNMPGQLAEFRIKRLNRPAAGATSWVNLLKWSRCGGAVDLERMKAEKFKCVMAIDLASTTDICSVRLTWHDPVTGEYWTYGKRYVCAEAVSQRTERGSVPYAAWVEQGLITQTEGDVTDYNVIQKDIEQLYEEFAPYEINYDRWNASMLVSNLVEKGLPMVEFVQGVKSYHPGVQALEMAYVGRKLHHGGDPVLKWCAANVIMRTDSNMNKAPDKKKSAEKIDDITTLFMGMARLSIGEDSQESFNNALKDAIIS